MFRLLYHWEDRRKPIVPGWVCMSACYLLSQTVSVYSVMNLASASGSDVGLIRYGSGGVGSALWEGAYRINSISAGLGVMGEGLFKALKPDQHDYALSPPYLPQCNVSVGYFD